MTPPWSILGMKLLKNTRLVSLDPFTERQEQLILEQKYHSVQARGENVEEVLRAHEKLSDRLSVHLL